MTLKMASLLLRLPYLLTWILLFVPYATPAGQRAVDATDAEGNTYLVADNRKPSLYTQNFGDCLGSSSINVTRFDAAYYQDNMTVLFHLEGSTNVANDSLMMYIGVFAYGESRFDLVFNPCSAQIYSLCPMNASVPIEANGIIPVDQQDVSGIPPLALVIPDFEGEAVLRIFSNATQSEIACYSGVITNGASFSQPAAVGTTVSIFVIAALAASFVTTIYVDSLATARTHYAHSLSIFVVFAVLQHIFFAGTLSMNWPSVLVAFWSNFAWSGGIIYSKSMQNSINQLIGSNRGNISEVGAASSGASGNGVGGGFDINAVYKRGSRHLLPWFADLFADHSTVKTKRWEKTLALRDSSGSSSGVVGPADGYNWYGSPAAPGLPLPGNFSGFAGTLAEEGIPASNAFMTGFLWFLILIFIVGVAVASVKGLLEVLARFGRLRTDRLVYFRKQWKYYLVEAVLRTCFIAFFMIMVLTMFEFTFEKSGAAVAIAGLVFVIFFVGMAAIASYACFYRLRYGRFEIRSDRLHLTKAKYVKVIPWVRFGLESKRSEKSEQWNSILSVPCWIITHTNEDPQMKEVHLDADYITKFGWLAARFRRTRWWFFAAWLIYEFIRACFYGGAAGYPMTQVFGLLVVEILALIFIITMRPFEGARLNALMVYLLGFSKVATIAFSAAFDSRFGLQRITTTVIGIGIIVLHGTLLIVLLIAIVIGCASSYLSLTRNQSDESFKPQHWSNIRRRYFTHLHKAAADTPPQPKAPPEGPKEPYFRVTSIYRQPKIEDEELDTLGNNSPLNSMPTTAYGSRANLHDNSDLRDSVTTVPFGAKLHRASWSTRDLENFHTPGGSARNSRHMSGLGLEAANRSSRALHQLNEDSDGTGSANKNWPMSQTPRSRVVSGYEGGLELQSGRRSSRPSSRPGTGVSISGKGKEKERALLAEKRSGEKIGVAVSSAGDEERISEELR